MSLGFTKGIASSSKRDYWGYQVVRTTGRRSPLLAAAFTPTYEYRVPSDAQALTEHLHGSGRLDGLLKSFQPSSLLRYQKYFETPS